MSCADGPVSINQLVYYRDPCRVGGGWIWWRCFGRIDRHGNIHGGNTFTQIASMLVLNIAKILLSAELCINTGGMWVQCTKTVTVSELLSVPYKLLLINYILIFCELNEIRK